MLKLNDLMRLSDDELKNTKVRFNQYNGEDNPIEEFKKSPEKLLKWNYWNSQKYKVGQLSIGLVKMSQDEWLLFTVGTITAIKDIPFNSGIGYEYRIEEDLYGDLFGRVIIKYHKTMQSQFPNADTVMDNLIVKEVLPSVFSGFDFPGYDKVSLTYAELETIVNGRYPSYKNALENQQAVYVLTDTNTGKLYVGSATSKNEMLLSRWKGYINTFHNGNEGLKELFKKEGADYFKKYFKYSILENFNSKVNSDFILEREAYWKKVLDTKKHGYNKN
ncbi:MAG: GIY-YIG nuclease family protein [Clostridia bacterium]|nr:GIY-YIG nuclease family protein [Clostridia bacterium]